MGAILAAAAWAFLIFLIVGEIVIDKLVNSLPGAHLFGFGPALDSIFVPLQIAFDLLFALFATLLTFFALHDARRDSGRRVGS
jgi:hypothetical protein